MDGQPGTPSDPPAEQRIKRREWQDRWKERKRVELGDEAFAEYMRENKRPTPEAKRRKQRRYAERVAERTTANAHAGGSQWTISAARTALDESLSVPEAALLVGRTAASVRSLRQRWRNGKLAPALASQLPIYRPTEA